MWVIKWVLMSVSTNKRGRQQQRRDNKLTGIPKIEQVLYTITIKILTVGSMVVGVRDGS